MKKLLIIIMLSLFISSCWTKVEDNTNEDSIDNNVNVNVNTEDDTVEVEFKDMDNKWESNIWDDIGISTGTNMDKIKN